ncbi:MAG: DUF4367 domain-containing protein [Oscillospiraceae bacterium]|nr:DUF4367 domain-containing protein [Oscillospiraceae bacterium]
MSNELTNAELEAKSLDELQDMLADSKIFSLDDETGNNYILRIAEVMERKENKPAEQIESERVAFWTKFIKRYGDDVPIQLDDVIGKSGSSSIVTESPKRATVYFVSTIWKILRRGLTTAAIVAIILVISGVAAVYAFNFNILRVINSFTENIFRKDFVSSETAPTVEEPGQNVSEGYEDSLVLQAILDKNGITSPKAPAFLPTGFDLVSAEPKEFPDRDRIVAIYKNGERSIILTIIAFSQIPSEHSRKIEKDNSNIEIYRHNGIDHYIFANMEQSVATWIDGMSDCDIQGDISVDEMKKIIDSMCLEE